MQSAGARGGEEAAATGTMTRRVLIAGAGVEEELDMARRVLVAEAVTVAVEVVAQKATGGSRARVVHVGPPSLTCRRDGGGSNSQGGTWLG